MRVTRLHLRDYRNLDTCVIDPHPRFNIIHGRNGQGKTNLLEAVYLLSTLKSFRSVRNADLIAWEKERAYAEAVVERREVERTFQLVVEKGGRIASVDGKRINRITEYFGNFNVVLFTPEDLAISKGEPAGRRRYLDRAVFNADAGHIDLLREYERALKSRNAVLRQSGGGGARLDASLLAAFDAPLSRLMARVFLSRIHYLEGLRGAFCDAYQAIAGEERDVEFRYRSSLHRDGQEPPTRSAAKLDADELADRALDRMRDTLGVDSRRGYTSVGPHADDLVASIDGWPVRRYGSQGQHRAFVLALKVAELDYLRETRDFRPVLLLDDVSSELDAERGQRFMELVSERQGQVFVTTTDRQYIPVDRDLAVWYIENGEVRRDGE